MALLSSSELSDMVNLADMKAYYLHERRKFLLAGCAEEEVPVRRPRIVKREVMLEQALRGKAVGRARHLGHHTLKMTIPPTAQ